MRIYSCLVFFFNLKVSSIHYREQLLHAILQCDAKKHNNVHDHNNHFQGAYQVY